MPLLALARQEGGRRLDTAAANDLLARDGNKGEGNGSEKPNEEKKKNEAGEERGKRKFLEYTKLKNN